LKILFWMKYFSVLTKILSFFNLTNIDDFFWLTVFHWKGPDPLLHFFLIFNTSYNDDFEWIHPMVQGGDVQADDPCRVQPSKQSGICQSTGSRQRTSQGKLVVQGSKLEHASQQRADSTPVKVNLLGRVRKLCMPVNKEKRSCQGTEELAVPCSNLKHAVQQWAGSAPIKQCVGSGFGFISGSGSVIRISDPDPERILN